MSSEINAVYNSVDEVYGCLEFTNKIKGALYQIAHNFVYIGFLLAECNDYQTYKEWGYNSIYEYALEQFNFKKSSVNNFINVCKTFSSNWSNHGHNLPYSMVLKDSYADFNYSQLVEMLSMNEKQRSQVTPDMTVKQIREVKKSSDESDSRRLECESSEGENDSNSLVKTYLGSRKVNEQNVFNFFDELEDLYLSFADSDKSLFDCAQQLFEKYSFYLNQDIYVYK